MIKLSPLPKTWLIDIDGTILLHNAHKTQSGDKILSGVREFFAAISPSDKIILLTARSKSEIPALKAFLARENLRYDEIIADLPFGEHILINDTKPSGLKTAHAINKPRNRINDGGATFADRARKNAGGENERLRGEISVLRGLAESVRGKRSVWRLKI